MAAQPQPVEIVEQEAKFHVCPACRSEVSIDGKVIRKVGESRTDHFVPIAEHNQAVKDFEEKIKSLEQAGLQRESDKGAADAGAAAESGSRDGKKRKVRFRF